VGGTPVIDYRITWDNAESEYVVLEEGVKTVFYATTVELIAGMTYKFKVESRNKFGFSKQFSEEISIKAIDPTPPTAPLSLAINPDVDEPLTVGLTWKAPLKNGGRKVLDYQVSLKIGFVKDGKYEVIASGVKGTSFKAQKLTGNVIYNFKV